MNMARRKTILLVEDNAEARESLALALEIQGYEVRQAENGMIAVDMVRNATPDVVIADLLMPLMDGVELARSLRAQHGEQIRLIALTGLSPQKTLGPSREAGFDFYVQKPIGGEDLVPYIENEIYRDE
jgi:DNA-binding response OmpR family regulator